MIPNLDIERVNKGKEKILWTTTRDSLSRIPMPSIAHLLLSRQTP